MKRTLAVLAVLPLVACSTQAQRQASHLQESIQAAQAEGQTCIDKALKHPAVMALRSKTNITGPLSLTQRADPSYANEEEISKLLIWDQLARPCREILVKGITKTAPSLAMVDVNTFEQADNLKLLLIKKKITWGEYNKRRSELMRTHQAERLRAWNNISGKLQTAHLSELQQRRQVAAMLQKWNYQQQQLANQRALINALNRPVVVQRKPVQTSCYRTGNAVDCTSY